MTSSAEQMQGKWRVVVVVVVIWAQMPIQLLLERSLSKSTAVKRMLRMKSSQRFNRINWAVRIEKISNEWAGCESELSYKYVQIVSSSDRWNLSRLISPHLNIPPGPTILSIFTANCEETTLLKQASHSIEDYSEAWNIIIWSWHFYIKKYINILNFYYDIYTKILFWFPAS